MPDSAYLTQNGISLDRQFVLANIMNKWSKFKKEFLETEVSMEKPHLFGFKTPVYTSNVGAPVLEYKGVSDNSGTFERNYSANNNNIIQKAFNALDDQQKIVLGWSGGPFSEWWEDSYSSSAAREEGDDPNLYSSALEDNPAAVATFNQKIPLKKDYKKAEYARFYFEKRKEFIKNPDPDKGEFTIPIHHFFYLEQIVNNLQ